MKKKILKWSLIFLVSGVATASGIGLYLYNMPHRDVQAAKVDYRISAEQLVQEYLTDAISANNKYLQEEGESKILAVNGKVASVTQDMKGQNVVLLKAAGADAGVSCTFMQSTNTHAEKLQAGEQVTIKGVIRSGAGYDKDLELYEDVIMEKCDILGR